jgi:hypothetical protein
MASSQIPRSQLDTLCYQVTRFRCTEPMVSQRLMNWDWRAYTRTELSSPNRLQQPSLGRCQSAQPVRNGSWRHLPTAAGLKRDDGAIIITRSKDWCPGDIFGSDLHWFPGARKGYVAKERGLRRCSFACVSRSPGHSANTACQSRSPSSWSKRSAASTARLQRVRWP